MKAAGCACVGLMLPIACCVLREIQREDADARDAAGAMDSGAMAAVSNEDAGSWIDDSESFRALLPSLKELLTLVDSTRHDPAMDPQAFSELQDATFWSSSEFLNQRNSVYTVEFGKGGIAITSSYYELYTVRCARCGYMSLAAARPALRPEKMQPPRNVPSSAR